MVRFRNKIWLFLTKVYLSLFFLIPLVVIFAPRKKEDTKMQEYKVTEISYKGHDYLVFRSTKSNVKVIEVTHDPDCSGCYSDSSYVISDVPRNSDLFEEEERRVAGEIKESSVVDVGD